MGVEPAQPAGEDIFGQRHAPCLEGGFYAGGGLIAAGKFESVSREAGAFSSSCRNKAKAERPSEKEYGAAFTEFCDGTAMFKEKSLFFAYPTEAGTHETQDVFQRNGGRGFYAHGGIGLHHETQSAAVIALEREVQLRVGQGQPFGRGGLS